MRDNTPSAHVSQDFFTGFAARLEEQAPCLCQEAAQYLQKGRSRKRSPSFSSFVWGRLLEHSFLEHFCLDQFSVIWGKFYMQSSRTPRLVEHFWVPILGASCSNKLFVGTLRPSHSDSPCAALSGLCAMLLHLSIKYLLGCSPGHFSLRSTMEE